MKGTLSEADLLMDSVPAPGQNYFPSVNFKKKCCQIVFSVPSEVKNAMGVTI
jgi:hypothetical protein